MNFSKSSTQIITKYGVVNISWEKTRVRELQMGLFEPDDRRMNVRHIPPNPESQKLITQLLSYFKGSKVQFETTLPENMGNPTQRKIWTSLRDIPYGQFETYGQLAKRLGLPLSAARALSNICAQNPQPILFPCHRIVASTGAMTGYAAGIQWKMALLELEGIPVDHGRIPIKSA